MIAEGKVAVLTAVANTKGEVFRLRDIVNATGQSRQNVYNHMKSLVSEGLVEKHLESYVVSDPYRLVEALTAPRSKDNTQLAPTKMYVDKNVKTLVNTVSVLTAARTLNLDGASELKRAINDEITETIALFKRYKYKVNNSEQMPKAAARKIDKQAVAEWTQTYFNLLNFFEVQYDPDTITSQCHEAIDDYL